MKDCINRLVNVSQCEYDLNCEILIQLRRASKDQISVIWFSVPTFTLSFNIHIESQHSH